MHDPVVRGFSLVPRRGGHDPKGSHYIYGIATPSARNDNKELALTDSGRAKSVLTPELSSLLS